MNTDSAPPSGSAVMAALPFLPIRPVSQSVTAWPAPRMTPSPASEPPTGSRPHSNTSKLGWGCTRWRWPVTTAFIVHLMRLRPPRFHDVCVGAEISADRSSPEGDGVFFIRADYSDLANRSADRGSIYGACGRKGKAVSNQLPQSGGR